MRHSRLAFTYPTGHAINDFAKAVFKRAELLVK
jgi:hypothetical protein